MFRLKLSKFGLISQFHRQMLPLITRKYCQRKNEKFTFDDLITHRKLEASKSILVQVSSEKSYSELYQILENFGSIKNSMHYKILEDDSNFILIEFEKQEECNEAVKNCKFNEEMPGVTVSSQFLWFKSGPKPKTKSSKKTELDSHQLQITDGNEIISEESLKELLRGSETLEDQILVLHRATTLNDLGTRLRFLAAKQVEDSMRGMFPNSQAFPFGSSVNQFGKMGCDLDLILKLNRDEIPTSKNSRLIFHTKANLANERSQVQRQMECMADILQLFLPGVSNVRRILQARVPIIKYNHEYLDLDIDLSMSNLTGLYMSELLYLFGEIDSRVRPLTFCIRKWASAVGLTNPSPGRWISNFSLTMLVLFFLQQMKTPILPSINLLIANATKDDIRITDDNINCTFLRDLNKLDFNSNLENKDLLGYLLIQFFEFYSQFDFTNRGISLNDGRSILKPDHSAMYIVNPFEPHLNVSKNLSLEETERFKMEVRNAAWILESTYDKAKVDNLAFWGLLSLFKTNKDAIIRPQMFFKPRMVDVSDLFDEKYNNEPPSNTIQFKSNSIKNHINAIKRETRANIKRRR